MAASNSFIIKEAILNLLLPVDEYSDGLGALPINENIDSVPLFSFVPLHHILHVQFLVVEVTHPVEENVVLLLHFNGSVSLRLLIYGGKADVATLVPVIVGGGAVVKCWGDRGHLETHVLGTLVAVGRHDHVFRGQF